MKTIRFWCEVTAVWMIAFVMYVPVAISRLHKKMLRPKKVAPNYRKPIGDREWTGTYYE